MQILETEFPLLSKAAFTHPAIDNHAHPLLRAEKRSEFPFEGLISEAQDAAVGDAAHTLSCFRATKQLSRLYGLKEEDGIVTWEAIKKCREALLDYDALCRMCFNEQAGISRVLVDDGLDGSDSLGSGYKYFDHFTDEKAKRIVRIERVAEDALAEILKLWEAGPPGDAQIAEVLDFLEDLLDSKLQTSARDPDVAGFKSIVCYRTGLNVSTQGTRSELVQAMKDICQDYYRSSGGKIRLAHKPINDAVVRIALQIAGQHGKPVQFHTGFGDNDLSFVLSSASHLQPIIKAYPKTAFVLLHASYPYTREAGYLTSVYKNVYLDFGEIFPIVSMEGQRNVIRQVLELCPTNKILWSSDGHWWPESFYLGILQAREALYHVLTECIRRQELSEVEAVGVVERALYLNAVKLYNL